MSPSAFLDDPSGPVEPVILDVCAGTITISNGPLNMDGGRFELRCPSGLCVFESGDGGRIFDGAPRSAVMSRMTLRNSQAPESDGGAIRLTGGELQLVDMDLRSNKARKGGALFVENGGSVEIVNSSFDSNSAVEVSGLSRYVLQSLIVLVGRRSHLREVRKSHNDALDGFLVKRGQRCKFRNSLPYEDDDF